MSHVTRTPAGHYRANWRDPAGRQRAKTFHTKREANAYLAEINSSLNRGTYVDPRAGRILLRHYVSRWVDSQHLGARAAERTLVVLRVHIRPAWGDWPLARIDHSSVQRWIRELSARLAPATVAKCFGVFRSLLASAVRDRLIAFNPAEGVRAPSTYQPRPTNLTISRQAFIGTLLPAVPPDHRALVCTAAGAGLRWGECAGLPWAAVDLDDARLSVGQVAVETAKSITIKPCPKTRAGVRTVPMPGFLLDALRRRHARLSEDQVKPRALVFATSTGAPLRRSNFRRQVWRPALVRAGLLGKVAYVAPDQWVASWPDKADVARTKEFTTEQEAVRHVAAHAAGGLRFHDLRHSYATWLVTAGTPINDVQAAMGHEQASTTLNRYTHHGEGSAARILAALDGGADFSLTFDDESEVSD